MIYKHLRKYQETLSSFERERERDSEYKKGRGGVTLQEKKIERGMAGGNYSEYIFCIFRKRVRW